MRFKRKHADADELLHTVSLANGLLEKLTALLRTILPLMQRLEMENSSAYREYAQALRTLEQLQHTNQALVSRVEEETPAPAPAEPDPAQKTGEDAPAPPDAALSRRVQLLFDRSASMESAAESIPGFSLFGSRRFPAGAKPRMFRRPAPPAAGPARPQTPAAPEAPPLLLSRPDSAAPPVPPMGKMQFSAVVSGPLLRGKEAVLHLFMMEKDLSLAAEELLRQDPAGPPPSRRGVVVRVALQSPDLALSGSTQTLAWPGEYLRFDFPLSLPEDFLRRQVLFSASVYINEVIATRLKFLVSCAAPDPQVILPRRRDVLSAFLSYAGEDRARAEAVLQGMQRARPDLHIFSDVEALRSSANWRQALPLEISRRDVFFLCWSHYAKESFWVNWEWNCALKDKGVACIEPIPLESPDRCPPPRDLDGRHFNDHLLQMMDAMQNGT